MECSRCGQDIKNRVKSAMFCWSCVRIKRNELSAKVSKARPLIPRATMAVNAAVKKGFLDPVKSLKCVDCGKQAAHYDHRDYTKPLEVVPVCARCNKLRGPGYPYLETAA